MNTPDNILKLLKKYNQAVEGEIDAFLKKGKAGAKGDVSEPRPPVSKKGKKCY